MLVKQYPILIEIKYKNTTVFSEICLNIYFYTKHAVFTGLDINRIVRLGNTVLDNFILWIWGVVVVFFDVPCTYVLPSWFMSLPDKKCIWLKLLTQLASVSDSFLLTASCCCRALRLFIIKNTETGIPAIAFDSTLEFFIRCTAPVMDDKYYGICILSFLIIIFNNTGLFWEVILTSIKC